MSFKVGTPLQGGRYVIEAVLGKGGFGLTYRATHTALGLPVVIKTLQERLLRSPQQDRFRSQLIDEARILGHFQHPSIVRVIDLFDEDPYPCMVMEYIPGVTLNMLAQAGQPMEESFAVYYVRQIATALSAIHGNGFLHRDVKPSNILRRDGNHRAILIDFGIAQTLQPPKRQRRSLSAHYAPPEQYQANQVLTPAADVYALAATLYYLLTGMPPVSAVQRKHKAVLPISQVQPNLTPGLEAAIAHGMALNLQDRPPTIQDWLRLIPRSVPAPVILGESSSSAATVVKQRLDRPRAKPESTASITQPQATVLALKKPEKRRVGASQTAPKLHLQSWVTMLRNNKKLTRSLRSTIIMASLIGGSLAFILRLTLAANYPLLKFEQNFPDHSVWPGTSSLDPPAMPTASPISTPDVDAMHL
jgi:serine/threonine protein kinase